MDDDLKKRILEQERQKLEDTVDLQVQLLGILVSVRDSIGDVKISEAINRCDEIIDFMCEEVENYEPTIEAEFNVAAFELKQKEIIDKCIQELSDRLEEE